MLSRGTLAAGVWAAGWDVTRSEVQQEFSDYLNWLKQRKGASYEWLARKTSLSRSSVHRYCSGAGFPQDFGTAENIAKACGADREELGKLYRLWSRAADSRADLHETSVLPVEDQPAAPQPPRSRSHLSVAAIALSLLLGVVTATAPEPVSNTAGGDLVQAGINSWAQAPAPVTSGFFGVTMNSSTGAMPTFQVGAVRLWDSRTRWANIQPRRGEFDWSILDRLVSGAEQRGLPVMFTMGGTPEWASPSGPRAAYDDGSRTSPPDDLADWDTFVGAVAQRYRGRIESYELWVMGNDTRYFSGTVETLAEMTRRANGILKAKDPKATVVCPSMGQLWKPEAQATLERFAKLGGYDHCDAAGVKLHQRQASEVPETMVELVATIDQAFHRAGAHPRLWSTGTTYEIPLAQSLDPQRAADFAVRFYLVGLYAQIRRMYFYNWGGTKIPIVLQPEGGPPTRAALYVEELQRWLRRAQIRSCGRGSQAGLPEGVWQCRFSGDDGRDFVIRWTPVGEVRMTAGAEVQAVQHLDGTRADISGDDALVITTSPVLLRLR